MFDCEELRNEEELNMNTCWYCGGELIWDCDYNYNEVYDDGEGIVTYLHCSNCGALIEYSLKEDTE